MKSVNFVYKFILDIKFIEKNCLIKKKMLSYCFKHSWVNSSALNTWITHILPLLNEYLRGFPEQYRLGLLAWNGNKFTQVRLSDLRHAAQPFRSPGPRIHSISIHGYPRIPGYSINMDIHDFFILVFNYPYKCGYPPWYSSRDIHARTFCNGYPQTININE